MPRKIWGQRLKQNKYSPEKYGDKGYPEPESTPKNMGTKARWIKLLPRNIWGQRQISSVVIPEKYGDKGGVRLLRPRKIWGQRPGVRCCRPEKYGDKGDLPVP